MLENVKLGVVDVILLAGSMAASALIGLYFTNKNKTIDSYMLGDKKLSVLPVAISLATSTLSGLSLLGASSEFYYQGTSYGFVAIPMLLCGPITAFTMLPIFYHLNELSLYRYLHKRFGLLIKYIVTVVFMLQMIFYNSVVLYMPSMALESIFNIERLYSILIIGLICVMYSGVGGLKAVVWTDFFQAILMYLAIIVVGALGTYDAGGFGEVYRQALEGGRFNLNGFWDVDLTTRHNFFGIMVGSTLKHVYLVGVNQVQIQRALSLSTLRKGQMAFIYCSMFGALIILLATYMGAVLVAAYKSCDPFLAKQIPRRDAIVVHFVANRLAAVPGLRGIFVAGLFSATLSTLSSFANSMAALAIEDFVRPMRAGRTPLSDSTMTWLAKALATLFGLICVLVAYVVDKANSRLLQATTTMFGAIGMPFLTSFALGIFTRFVNTCGILAGFAVTLTLGAYVTINQIFYKPPLQPQLPTYYDQQCERVFNQTMSSSKLPSLLEVLQFDYARAAEEPATKLPFSVDQISYMMMPIVQFVLMIIVASVVSLLTGGWKQQVPDEYLVPFMRKVKSSGRGKSSSDSGDKRTDQTTNRIYNGDLGQQDNNKFAVLNKGFERGDD